MGEIAKKIIIVAGPNGAGKTTFARSFLPVRAHCPRFINADLIAAGLSPFKPEAAAVKAGRLMLREIAQCATRGENFGFETTLAGLGYLQHIKRWREQGYHVSLFFLGLKSVDIAINRVAKRIEQGGHAIEIEVIRRRFASGLLHFQQFYRAAVDDWAYYDNSGDVPVLIEWKDG